MASDTTADRLKPKDSESRAIISTVSVANENVTFGRPAAARAA
jgi:hypothetical protein